jgi:hypothetical protein
MARNRRPVNGSWELTRDMHKGPMPMSKESAGLLKVIRGAVGTLLGGSLGYALLVDEWGRWGFRYFLEGRVGLERALHSATFWQIAIPAAGGALLGVFLNRLLGGK